MKVVCKDNSGGSYGDEELYHGTTFNMWKYLEVGKSYDVESIIYNGDLGYMLSRSKILADQGHTFCYFNTRRFESLDKVRNDKLNQLGII